MTLEESKDLLSYIELSELTHEFGGTLSYNHAHWCIFTEVRQSLVLVVYILVNNSK